MDIKSRNYSHAILTKVIVFIITILCFSIGMTLFLNIFALKNGDFNAIFEKDYYLSRSYMKDSSQAIESLTNLITEYKSEEYILAGQTITDEEVKRAKDDLFSQFKHHENNDGRNYDPKLSDVENYEKFENVYKDEIAQIKDELIAEDLKQYNSALRKLEGYKGIYYYGSDGENVITNSPNSNKEFFKSYPSYVVFDKSKETVYPRESKENPHYYLIRSSFNKIEQSNNAVYMAFTEEFLNPRIEAWENNKVFITNNLYLIVAFTFGLVAAFIFLILIIGRKFFGDQEVHLNFMDKLYNDFNIIMCFILIGSWIGIMDFILFFNKVYELIFPITLIMGALGLILVLSLAKHIKNKTFIKHTLTFTILYKIFKFIQEIYDSGSIGMKVAIVVIGYPILVAITFFMFPITIGIGVWLSFKKVKEYIAIKEGVAKVKEGDLNHKINISGNGEFAKLASHINSITDGLNKAVANELKSERLKAELITNVSHDIRTPLTSIITYVDLLKNEQDQIKTQEYIDIIEQKSQRLKILTDDLFEASKASSGNIPVNYEKIDIVSLITQGLGEVDDKIIESELDFKVNYPQDKVFITADGKLLWRAIENLLSNIFKYALPGSRVYIDIEDLGTEVMLIIKNISAHELNISSGELMERFKRGDEARSTQGSGLGLSIAKSLIEIQKGSFKIEIDGDLFKAIVKMPK